MSPIEFTVEIPRIERYHIAMIWRDGLFANSFPALTVDDAYNQVLHLVPEEPVFGDSSPSSIKVAQYILDLWLGAWPKIIQNLSLDFSGLTEKTQQILQVVSSIPYGETRTYQQVAQRASMPNAYRFVGNVMAKNRFPLLIPCHRVVSKSGIGGYGRGTDLKKRLLAAEKNHMLEHEAS
jgi:O-6-methylguanine DNA methyltransferase